jgi:hypothetical protein
MRNLKIALLVVGIASASAASAPAIIAADGRVAADAASMALPAASGTSRDEDLRTITIPAGTPLTVRLGSSVSSRTSRIEDPVNATIVRPIVINGATVVPAGTAVTGYVSQAERSGRVKGRARIGVRFNALRVDGTRYRVQTASINRVAPGTKKADAAKIGIGAGAGAVVGAIAGGKKGAAIGSAVGAGGGTGVVLATRGREVALGCGATLTMRLTQPVTVRLQE